MDEQPGAAHVADTARRAPVLRSPLAQVFERLDPPAQAARAGVQVAEWADVACLVVRGHRDDDVLMAAVASVFNLNLPLRPSTWVATDGAVALWMSPDEWWILLPRVTRDVMMHQLARLLEGRFCQLVDISGSFSCLRLAGPDALTVLRHLSPYDVQAMPTDACVSTVVHKAQLTLVRTDDQGIMLIVRRSFAPWIWRLITAGARPYGLARCAPAQLPAGPFSTLLG